MPVDERGVPVSRVGIKSNVRAPLIFRRSCTTQTPSHRYLSGPQPAAVIHRKSTVSPSAPQGFRDKHTVDHPPPPRQSFGLVFPTSSSALPPLSAFPTDQVARRRLTMLPLY